MQFQIILYDMLILNRIQMICPITNQYSSLFLLWSMMDKILTCDTTKRLQLKIHQSYVYCKYY